MPRSYKPPSRQDGLDEISQRRDLLAAELTRATAEQLEADDNRRALLIEGGLENQDALAGADLRCREAESRKASLEDAVRAIVERIETLTAARDAERERAEREARASRLEDAACRIESLFKQLQGCLAEAGALLADLEAAIPGGVALGRREEPSFNSRGVIVSLLPLAPRELMAAVLADSLAQAMPNAFAIEPQMTPIGPAAFKASLNRMMITGDGRANAEAWNISDIAPPDPHRVCGALIVGPLRKAAAELRAASTTALLETTEAA